MKKRTLIIILAALLAAACIAGAGLLLSGGDEAEPTGSPQTAEDVTRRLWRLSHEKHIETDGAEFSVSDCAPVYEYEGRLCRVFNYYEADSGVRAELRSLDGEVLKSYTEDCFPLECMTAFMEDGSLYAVLGEASDGGAVFYLGKCEPGLSRNELTEIPYELDGRYPERVVKSGDYLLMPTSGDEHWTLRIVNTASGTEERLEDVFYWCVADGDLLCRLDREKGELYCRTLDKPDTLWSAALPVGSSCRQIFDAGDGRIGLVLNDFLDGTNRIELLSAADGSSLGDLINPDADMGEDAENLSSVLYEEASPYQQTYFAADAKGNIGVSMIDGSFDDGFTVSSWLAESYEVTVDLTELVTLTITSPYPVLSLRESIRSYQRLHPEVEVVWDCEYATREDFQLDVLQYRERLALRLMTGDVGDIVMINGSGLSQDNITKTDALADVSEYLESCVFSDELEWTFFESLRGQDGCIRAVPIAWQPSYYIYNMDIAERCGIDPYTAAWSELFDLALEWQEAGLELGLTHQDASYASATQKNILRQTLLSSLYGAMREDGTLELDTSEFRSLMTKLKQLWDTPWLVRPDGSRLTPGSMTNSLFYIDSSPSVSDALSNVTYMEENNGVRCAAAPVPFGANTLSRQGYAFCWGISSFSSQKDEAWKLLEHFLGKNGLPGRSYTSDTLPVNGAAARLWHENRMKGLSEYNAERYEKPFGQMLKLAEEPYARLEEPYGWADAVYSPLLAYMEGELTLDDAVKTAEENWARTMG